MKPVKPLRKIDAISAVFLPFLPKGRPDFEGFGRLLERTASAGIKPAVNMDTGFGPQLTPKQRIEILAFTRKTLGPGAPFVAGAMPFGGDSYENSIRSILEVGGTPILFQSELFASGDVVSLYRRLTADCPRALAFELGTIFAPFGRIYDLDTFRRLMEIPALVGLKHSSLSRELEWERLEVRDRERPEFRVYTGNDLAIDMVMYGSDYLLGLSAFDPEAFAIRDGWWAAGDDRFFEMNDALQALGAVAFRDPVPAYKDSAAHYLRLTGILPEAEPHPNCPRRPNWESELLRPLAERIAKIKGRS